MRMSEGLILGFDLVLVLAPRKDVRRKCPETRMNARHKPSEPDG
jgi:hypothetical protein